MSASIKFTAILIGVWISSNPMAFSSLYHPSEERSHGKLPESGAGAIGKLASCFSYYHILTEGKYPESWDQLEEALNEVVPSKFQEPDNILDVKKRYILFNPPISLQTSGEHFEALAIGVNGNLPERSRNSEPSRFLIIKNTKGIFRGRGFSEASLEYILKRANLDLADYTKPTPPFSKTKTLSGRKLDETPSRERAPLPLPSTANSKRNNSPINGSGALVSQLISKWPLIAATFVLLAAFAYWLTSRLRHGC